MTNPDERAAVSRRGLLRGAALGGTAHAVASALPAGPASATGGQGGGVPQVPGVTTVVDTSHASHDVAVLFSDYFRTKSAKNPDGLMAFFARKPMTYIDAILGWPFYSWQELHDLFATYMPKWPADGTSSPVRILDQRRGVLHQHQGPVRPVGDARGGRGELQPPGRDHPVGRLLGRPPLRHRRPRRLPPARRPVPPGLQGVHGRRDRRTRRPRGLQRPERRTARRERHGGGRAVRGRRRVRGRVGPRAGDRSAQHRRVPHRHGRNPAVLRSRRRGPARRGRFRVIRSAVASRTGR